MRWSLYNKGRSAEDHAEESAEEGAEDNACLSPCIRALLAAMEYDTPYSADVLMEKLGLRSKEGFRRNYLRPALDMQLIRMTIPDKPTSKNQRYVKG